MVRVFQSSSLTQHLADQTLEGLQKGGYFLLGRYFFPPASDSVMGCSCFVGVSCLAMLGFFRGRSCQEKLLPPIPGLPRGPDVLLNQSSALQSVGRAWRALHWAAKRGQGLVASGEWWKNKDRWGHGVNHFLQVPFSGPIFFIHALFVWKKMR